MRVSVEEMLKEDNKSSNQKPNYFSLKKDGDYAIVRFLHKTADDFDVLDTHRVTINGYARGVNCLRTLNGSKDECELCKANAYNEETKKYAYPIQRKIYIHLLRYDNPQSCTEEVWERSKDFIQKLNQFALDYGPLCNRLYKIVRHGAEQSRNTTYDIMPLDRDRFDPSEYKFNESQLNYKSALGTVVLDVDNNRMLNYLRTGSFKLNNNITPRPMPDNPPPENRPTYFVNNSNNIVMNDSGVSSANTQPIRTSSYSESEMTMDFDTTNRRRF